MDSVSEIDGLDHGEVIPAKLKIDVSCCRRCCSKRYLRDIGAIKTNGVRI